MVTAETETTVVAWHMNLGCMNIDMNGGNVHGWHVNFGHMNSWHVNLGNMHLGDVHGRHVDLRNVHLGNVHGRHMNGWDVHRGSSMKQWLVDLHSMCDYLVRGSDEVIISLLFVMVHACSNNEEDYGRGNYGFHL